MGYLRTWYEKASRHIFLGPHLKESAQYETSLQLFVEELYPEHMTRKQREKRVQFLCLNLFFFIIIFFKLRIEGEKGYWVSEMKRKFGIWKNKKKGIM